MVRYLFLLLTLWLAGCSDNPGAVLLDGGRGLLAADELPKLGQKVTFVELGSLSCTPCRQMQPVMEAVEQKYGAQLLVVFYDIQNPEQGRYAGKYGVRVIPTQVFLDSAGREFFRHEGFLSEEQIDMLLKSQGLVPIAVKHR